MGTSVPCTSDIGGDLAKIKVRISEEPQLMIFNAV